MADSGLITFDSDGDEIRGYLSKPLHIHRPGLILIPDVRGLGQHFIDVAGRFAAEGFATLALDLYSREGAPVLPDVSAALAWMRNLPDKRVLADIGAAARYMSRVEGITIGRMGITGFCMGGQYALMAACSQAGFAACVSWYGMLRYTEKSALKPHDPLDMADKLQCPYLGLFGAQDELIPATDVEELRRLLSRSGKEFEIQTYAGAGHAFFNDSRPEVFRPLAAADAWSRATAFLEKALTGGG
jgi:carboxymethylenebutenolidase